MAWPRGNRLRRVGPVVLVLLILTLLGYPFALVLGLPLALRDMRDLRKWETETVVAAPIADVSPQEVNGELLLSFPVEMDRGVLVRGGSPLDLASDASPGWNAVHEGREVRLRPPGEGAAPAFSAVSWAATLEPLSPTVYSFGESIPERDPERALYVGTRLALEGAQLPRELPDGQRTLFSFRGAEGPVIVGGRALVEGEDYTALNPGAGTQVALASPPPFGSSVRRVSGDYAVLNAAEGTVLFSAPPGGEVRAAASVLRLAEVLEGEVDGTNRLFSFGRGRVLENDPNRAVFLDGVRLSDAPERPGERVDGVRRDFSFGSSEGIVTVDGVPLAEGQDYTRDGPLVSFVRPPARNAALRQYEGAFLVDPMRGDLLLAEPPAPGSVVWAESYTVYTQPACGSTVLECFYALPQHPAPFPHWIAQRLPAFFQKHSLADERHVLRATLYTALGTMSALALGGAVGIILAVMFVLVRPLERALLPWVVGSQTVPIIALVPVLLLILGNFGITIQTSMLPTALIGAYLTFFPVAVGTVKGLRSVDPLALDLMTSYAASPLEVFMKVRFPAAAPFFFTSLKLGAAAALVGALVAETESNNRRGLGFAILGQVQSGNVADVWILLLVSAVLGILLVSFVGLLQRLIAPWERA